MKRKGVIHFPRERVSRDVRLPKDGVPSVIALPVICVDLKSIPVRNDLVPLTVAILRRRTLTPHHGRSVTVEFETEMEAAEFHKLILLLPKMKRRRKR